MSLILSTSLYGSGHTLKTASGLDPRSKRHDRTLLPALAVRDHGCGVNGRRQESNDRYDLSLSSRPPEQGSTAASETSKECRQ